MNNIFKYKLLSFLDEIRSNRMINSLSFLLQSQKLTLVDIGAADSIQPRWLQISKLINYIGFEPDQRSYDELLEKKNTCHSYKIYNTALWSENLNLPINLLKKPLVSSFYEPNIDIIKNFPDKERFNLVETKTYSAKKIDDLEIENTDFMKLDVQGGELEIIKGGNLSLEKCIGLEIEVEFVKLYKEQPLFGDISNYLDEKGFIFIDFTSLARWERHQYKSYGQLIFGDALFLRPPEIFSKNNNIDLNYLKKYIAICFLYKRFDLINDAISYCNQYRSCLEYIKLIKKKIDKSHRSHLRQRLIFGILLKPFRLFNNFYQSHLIY